MTGKFIERHNDQLKSPFIFIDEPSQLPNTTFLILKVFQTMSGADTAGAYRKNGPICQIGTAYERWYVYNLHAREHMLAIYVFMFPCI